MSSLKAAYDDEGMPLVTFPTDFEELVELSSELQTPNRIVDVPYEEDDILSDPKVRKEMDKIRKLDMMLAKKVQEEKVAKKQLQDFKAQTSDDTSGSNTARSSRSSSSRKGRRKGDESDMDYSDEPGWNTERNDRRRKFNLKTQKTIWEKSTTLQAMLEKLKLTEEQEQRVETILSEQDEGLADTPLFQPGKGYTPANDDITRLVDIDCELQSLYPEDEWEERSITSASVYTPSVSNLKSVPDTVKTTATNYTTASGHRDYLREQREHAEEKERLKDINNKLNLLREEAATPRAALSDDMLKKLLEDAKVEDEKRTAILHVDPVNLEASRLSRSASWKIPLPAQVDDGNTDADAPTSRLGSARSGVGGSGNGSGSARTVEGRSSKPVSSD
eukprot:GFYU01009442.1.p1 GENE.GFYU01009442.1~~GFYU01009442.1.p1  ORF type:complete len:390 (-),score=130.20 GFYU01009442.1:302-1471(-)